MCWDHDDCVQCRTGALAALDVMFGGMLTYRTIKRRMVYFPFCLRPVNLLGVHCNA